MIKNRAGNRTRFSDGGRISCKIGFGMLSYFKHWIRFIVLPFFETIWYLPVGYFTLYSITLAQVLGALPYYYSTNTYTLSPQSDIYINRAIKYQV